MTIKRLIFVIVALVLAPGMVAAKGPQYQKSAGYSGSGVSRVPSSKVTKPSRFPTQTPQRMPTGRPQTTSSPKPTSPTAFSTKSKYSTQRPQRYPVGQPSVSTPRPVTFPSGPASTSRPSSVATQNVRPTKSPTFRPSQQPPAVFYPQQTSASNSQPSRVPPTTKPATKPSSLRPSWAGASQQRPPTTVINNQTNITQNQTNVTNVTNNIGNVNQWFQQNNWQNQVTINSQHWNGRPWWYRPDYGDWHHGHWHSNAYNQGRNSWDYVDSSDHQWLSGLAAWGLGNLIYRSGYQVYSNPYFVRSISIGTTTINYSRPICVQRSQYEIAYANNQELAQRLRTQSLAHFAAARISFYRGLNDQAYQSINQAIALMPDDTSMHEFRALVLFAAGNYREAAEVMHAVLAVAPGWDWTTLSGLYPDNDVYTQQLRRLETYILSNPRDPSARFLLAYHYVTVNAPESAAAQLRIVLTLLPNDRLSSDLLTLLVQREQATEASPPVIVRIDERDLEGDWKARRPDGSIELELNDGEFKWDYDLINNDQLLRGKYLVDRNLLIFATQGGSQMVGTVVMRDRNHFIFRLLGSSESDQGLEFLRR